MIIEIGLVIFIIADVVGCYVIWNLMKKTEMLETWIENFTESITQIEGDLKVIDQRVHFKADDEIGTIFEQINETVSQLYKFTGEEVDAT